MAVFDHSARQHAGFVTVLATRVVRAATSVLRAWNNRKQFRRLRDMSDWELADIGLRRDDLHDAWKRRIDTDPLRCLDPDASDARETRTKAQATRTR
jgi:uncharacterized protein YjiS (DUF1127 family)